MCGIVGQVSKNKVINQKVFNEMRDSMAHRGPDGFGTQLLQDGHVALGHRRLSIIDLSEDGKQPMSNANGDIWVTFNGEIYNYPALKELLIAAGYAFQSKSDTEVLIHGYSHWGIEELLKRLKGMFAFALWDERKGKLMAARDRFGIKPFVYYSSENQFVFASEIKAIMPYYEIVSPFPPGHIQVYDASTNAILFDIEYHATPWITHPSYRVSEHPSSRQSAAEALRYALEESVRKRMLTERPCAALLSGGLDSSLIAALVQKNLKQLGLPSLQTFSIGFAGSSDLFHAKLVADHIGSNHTEIVMTPDDFFKAIPRVIAAIESCDTTTVRASVGNFLVAEQIRKRTDCKVVFNGDGSDELFGGYLYFYNAPSDAAFHSETGRLLKDLHYFDVLRSDRCISAHGLEARTPFLDKQFVSVVRSIDPAMLRPIRGVQTEKYILRYAFDDGITLPREVLWRRKEAFSDGVSTPHKSWYEEIKERVEEIVPPNWLMKATLHYSNWLPVKTAEEYYYRSLFTMNYGLAAVRVVLPYRWMPKWCPETTDPSARTLASYADPA
jgi:asparagine synthase (glutamine-hydrolysing)